MAIPPQVIMMAAQLMQQRQQKLAAKKQKLVSELPDIATGVGSLLQQTAYSDEGEADVRQATFASALQGGAAGASLGPLGILGGAVLGGVGGFSAANQSNADFYDAKALNEAFKLSGKTVSPSAFGKGGMIEGEDMIPVQMELGEVYVTPELNIYDSKAKTTHEEMDKSLITDVVKQRAFAFSNRKNFNASKYADEVLGYGFAHYTEDDNYSLEQVKMGDVFGDSSKEIPFSEAIKKVQQKYKTVRETDKDADVFTRTTNQENKQARLPYVNRLISLHEGNKTNVEPIVPQQFAEGGPIDGLAVALKNTPDDNSKARDPYYQSLLNAYAKEKNINPETLDKELDRIIFHETGGTMDAASKQKGGGPGRGGFQFEMGDGRGAYTALKRLESTSNNEYGLKIPDEMYDITNNNYDVSILPLDLQKALFLGNDRKHPVADISKVVKGQIEPVDYWGKYHQTQDDPKKKAKFERDSLRFEKLKTTPKFANGGFIDPNDYKPIFIDGKPYYQGSDGQVYDKQELDNLLNQQSGANDIYGNIDNQFEKMYTDLDQMGQYNTEIYNQNLNQGQGLYNRMNTRAGLAGLIGGLSVGMQSTRVDPKFSDARFVDQMYQEVSPAVGDQLAGQNMAYANSLLSNIANDDPKLAERLAPKLYDSALSKSNDARLSFLQDNLETRIKKYGYLNRLGNANRNEAVRADEETRNLINKKRRELANVGINYLQDRDKLDVSQFTYDQKAQQQMLANDTNLYQQRMNLNTYNNKYQLSREDDRRLQEQLFRSQLEAARRNIVPPMIGPPLEQPYSLPFDYQDSYNFDQNLGYI